MEQRELIIIGAGPAGLTAAIYARRAGIDTLVLEKAAIGGQIILTNEVENWPGTKKIAGYDLASSLQEHAEHFGAEIRAQEITGLDLSGARKIVHTANGDIAADAVIIASGARHRALGIPGEAELTGKGVSYCAVCDGPFFRNEEIAVVGGGDTAVEEAEFLTRFASKVYIVHRRDKFRATEVLSSRALANPKIVPVWDSVATSVNGADTVTSLTVENVKTGEKKEIPVGGVFMFIGILPNTEIFQNTGLELAPGGWVAVDQANLATNIPGVYAAGDVRVTSLRQMVTAAADGARAAMATYSYLTELSHS